MSQITPQSFESTGAVQIAASPLECRTSSGGAPPVYHVGMYDGQLPNGVVKVIYSYCELLQNELDCHVVSLDLHDPCGYVETQQGSLTLHQFGAARGKGFLPPRLLKQWLSSLPRDVIFHLHCVFTPSNYVLARILKRRGIRYVYTPHDSYSPASLEKNRCLKRLYIRLFEKPILNNAWRVHALSRQGQADITALTRTPTRLVPNFVLPLPQVSSAAEQRAHVCFVGRLDIFQKGLDLALRCYKRFCEMVVDPPPFLLVGPEQEGSMPKLLALCNQLELEVGREVQFVGRVDEQQKARLLQTSLVYLQLSRFEGFGLSIVEALSAGVPVVISDQVPIADEIEAMHAGKQVASIEDAARALQQIKEMSSADYASFSANARKCYEQKYSQAAVRSAVVKLYQEDGAAT